MKKMEKKRKEKGKRKEKKGKRKKKEILLTSAAIVYVSTKITIQILRELRSYAFQSLLAIWSLYLITSFLGHGKPSRVGVKPLRNHVNPACDSYPNGFFAIFRFSGHFDF